MLKVQGRKPEGGNETKSAEAAPSRVLASVCGVSVDTYQDRGCNIHGYSLTSVIDAAKVDLRLYGSVSSLLGSEMLRVAVAVIYFTPLLIGRLLAATSVWPWRPVLGEVLIACLYALQSVSWVCIRNHDYHSLGRGSPLQRLPREAVYGSRRRLYHLVR